MKILMIASESLPLVKTGGLADVVFSLSKELHRQGHHVDIMIPEYQSILGAFAHEKFDYFQVPINTPHDEGVYKKVDIDGMTFYLVSSDFYFDRGGVIYGHGDEFERFGLFQLAALEFLRYHEYDVVHCHDWQTGLIPYMIQTLQEQGLLKQLKTVFTIHNLAYQGVFELDRYKDLFLPYSTQLEMHGMLNFMKTGIMAADVITTVSPTYAKEILSPERGEGLHDILWMRKDDFVGVLNGLDVEMFNPRTDTMITPYDGRTFTKAKAANKKELQQTLGLPVQDVMVLGMVSRLTSQKGIYLLLDIIDQLPPNEVQIVILGSGDAMIEQDLRRAQARYPSVVGLHIGYSEPMARLIYAGSDAFVMPSMFEPCGLAQLIAMRFGTLPIVRATGGLADTVIDHTEGGCGFVFHGDASDNLLLKVQQAHYLYQSPATWRPLVQQAMKQDFSWKKPASTYLSLYRGELWKH
jgi:starch synthase